MGQNTKISWARHAWNPWWGCTKVSEACANCYAEAFARRLGKNLWGPGTSRMMQSEKYWAQLLRWDRAAEREGMRSRVFTASMADILEDHPQVGRAREMFFRYIELCRNLDFLLLTKRPENFLRMVPRHWREGFPQNVWPMATVELQQHAETRIGYLLELPAMIVGISCEPLLGELDLSPWIDRLDWVIVGDESGPKRRPTDIRHVLSLRDQCSKAKTSFFLKQLHVDGKKVERPYLEGRQWLQVPGL